MKCAIVKRADGGRTELRGNINHESFNGVYIDNGEEIKIQSEAVATDGSKFLNVVYGKKKGWIRAEHVQQSV